MKVKKPIDFWIFITVLILLSMGLIMVFSASAPYAYNNTKNHDVYFFLKGQLRYALIGLAAMFVCINIDYKKLGKWSSLFLIFSIILLILVLIPGIGHEENGSQRWIYIGAIHFQPSEFAKLSIILFFAYSLSRRRDQLQSFFKGLLPYLVILGIFSGILLLEPHFSCTIVIISVAIVMLFSAGARIKHFVLLALPAVVGLGALAMFSEYRRARLLSFLDPWKDLHGNGWQVVQSLYAIGSGGLFGRGLGKSLQKFLYIPEPQNDFILAVLAEELGFIGVLAVLLLFLIFIWRGIKVAINAPDVFGSLVAVGITSLVAVQVIINVAVVTSSMPVTGMPLPFFSAGGTALLFLMCGIGILLNISRQSNYERV
ncbi:MAG: stage V sporulation protein E [Clostridiales bacterium]|jgi:cell division protein FtsW|nr:stage V sporulation protein E [Eubacteriales bacterium]MDH7564935.1 stage V sporulation protein E [Clostridiales bacterium]